MLVDFDVMVLLYLRSIRDKELRRFRNPLEIIRDYGGFMKTLIRKGILKTGLRTHPTISLLIVIIFFIFRDLLIPVFLGVASHLFADGVHVIIASREFPQNRIQ